MFTFGERSACPLRRKQRRRGTAQNFVLCLFALGVVEPCAAQTVFSTEREFGPVRFSQPQLLELLDRLQTLADGQGSTTSGGGNASHTLSLSDGQNTLELSGDLSMEALSPAPPVATSVRYFRRNPTGFIRSVSVRFSDSNRTLEVSGLSQDQVDAVANLGGELIGRAETSLGGAAHRGLVGSILLALGLGLSYVARAGDLGRRARFLMAAIGVLSLALGWLSLWNEWFPGSVVYRDHPSFWIRHAALLAFLGVMATMGTLAVQVLGAFRRWRRTREE